ADPLGVHDPDALARGLEYRTHLSIFHRRALPYGTELGYVAVVAHVLQGILAHDARRFDDVHVPAWNLLLPVPDAARPRPMTLPSLEGDIGGEPDRFLFAEKRNARASSAPLHLALCVLKEVVVARVLYEVIHGDLTGDASILGRRASTRAGDVLQLDQRALVELRLIELARIHT